MVWIAVEGDYFAFADGVGVILDPAAEGTNSG
jgi:hypothetical protein